MKTQKELLLSRMICSLALKIQKTADRMLTPYNITMEQLWVLRCLSVNSSKTLTQSELCRKSFKAPANITRIIDRLERKSFVVRQASPDDRRSYLVALTKRGQLLIRETDTILDAFSYQFGLGVDPASLSVTKHVLNIMNTNMSKMPKNIEEKVETFL